VDAPAHRGLSDVGDVTVEVITLWPGHAAEEVERLITIQLEKELNGVANVTFLRSASLFGLSNIRVLFADGTDKYWARQQVQERIAGAEVPTDARPTLGSLSSVIGESTATRSGRRRCRSSS